VNYIFFSTEEAQNHILLFVRLFSSFCRFYLFIQWPFLSFNPSPGEAARSCGSIRTYYDDDYSFEGIFKCFLEINFHLKTHKFIDVSLHFLNWHTQRKIYFFCFFLFSFLCRIFDFLPHQRNTTHFYSRGCNLTLLLCCGSIWPILKFENLVKKYL